VTRLVVLALALGLLVPASAGAGTLLQPADETELAQSLADATEAQDVCYGWKVFINGVVTDQGSSEGPRAPVGVGIGCKRYAQLEASLQYTCDSCEGDDSGAIRIDSNLAHPPTVKDLEDLGYHASDLVGDKDDVTLEKMVGELPLITAQRGDAPLVAYEPAASVPKQDGPTNTPGSDLLRDRWFGLVLFGGLLLFAPLWFFYKRAERAAMTR
jgi:hypothetical protein